MKLKLGLPKGSLQEATFALFARAGFSIKVSSRSYQPVIDDDTIDPILLRPQEIPIYLADGVIDAGLTGADWIADSGAQVHEICELRYSKLTNNPIRVVLAVHQDSPVQGPKDLEGKRIATEYVRLTERYLSEHKTQAHVEFSWGACEVKVPSLVDAIVVNTETGNSLRAHNLRIVDTLLTSTTRFVASRQAMEDDWKREKVESLEILLTGAMNAAKLVGLKMNLPMAQKEEILGILPSLKNPTLSPLADADWIAAEVILSEREVRDLIPRLKRAGATGLVEYPLNKVIY
ncbi:ATP phosphoribosyltransferase [Fimbriimonas ginsengisoli]|uniref:ATP phosphoribosyltransferase n=1 Tax=Fimbriimonas ginsengisoli Gsoil 348 TaxID=661478 RepID=A0A068NPE2_FIMGI|nr:ATP phosphoribosyltransferase [Fimbriimonas ginsengisoli]AIE85242.1 ATP phosphoribosyltransferase [Fimbriimonas ginsengisoli Gsoil 348]